MIKSLSQWIFSNIQWCLSLQYFFSNLMKKMNQLPYTYNKIEIKSQRNKHLSMRHERQDREQDGAWILLHPCQYLFITIMILSWHWHTNNQQHSLIKLIKLLLELSSNLITFRSGLSSKPSHGKLRVKCINISHSTLPSTFLSFWFFSSA